MAGLGIGGIALAQAAQKTLEMDWVGFCHLRPVRRSGEWPFGSVQSKPLACGQSGFGLAIGAL